MSYNQDAMVFYAGTVTPPGGASEVLYTVPAGKFARVRYFQASTAASGSRQIWIGQHSGGSDIAYVDYIGVAAPLLTVAWKGWQYVGPGDSLAFWCSGTPVCYVLASGELVTPT